MRYRKYPDELIGHMRWLHAERGVSCAALARRYGLSANYTEELMKCRARPFIKPARCLQPGMNFED